MKNEFAKKLNAWYEADHRDLPFRRQKDPYAIWVSEVMAQQTRIESMLPYYKRWIEQWPTIESLADAQIEDVLHLWQGLGYYNRARKLHEGAKVIVEQHGGQMPESYEELIQIPGVGPYTAGAILSIAFQKNAAAVDGNVLRVMARVELIEEDISKNKTHRLVEEKVLEKMENPSVFTQALMELGARICTPKHPLCSLCPVQENCKAFVNHRQEDLPYKSPKKKPLELKLHTYLIVSDQKVLLSADDSDGLMKGLRRLPQFEEKLHLDSSYLGEMKHVFSHRIWQMSVHLIEKKIELENCEWVPIERLDEVSIVTAHRKLLKKYFSLM